MLLGRHGDYFPKDVEPLYVRPCDAVENLPSLAERMGMDAGEAVELVSPAEAFARIQACAEREALPVFACGSGLARNRELEARLLASCGGRVRVRADIVSPSVEALMLLGRHGDYFPKDVEPLYVRPCDAVENLPSLAERMGMDAGEAVEELQDKLGRRPESAI